MLEIIMMHFCAFGATLAILYVLQEEVASKIRNSVWGWFALIWYPLLVSVAAKGWFFLWDYWNIPSIPGIQDQAILVMIGFFFVTLILIYLFKIYLPAKRSKKQWDSYLENISR